MTDGIVKAPHTALCETDVGRSVSEVTQTHIHIHTHTFTPMDGLWQASGVMRTDSSQHPVLCRRGCFTQALGALMAICLGARAQPLLAATDANEPQAAARLFEILQGRRPSSFSASERMIVDSLIDELVTLRVPWNVDAARGKWRLAYLQRSPNSSPAPLLQLPSNEQYQIFSRSDVINVAELVGPSLEIRAAGAWRDNEPADMRSPKRFRVDITAGALCGTVTLGRAEKANIGRACMPLPLRGETYRVVDGQYVGPRIRIAQDLNSGGARVVQLRVIGFAGR